MDWDGICSDVDTVTINDERTEPVSVRQRWLGHQVRIPMGCFQTCLFKRTPWNTLEHLGTDPGLPEEIKSHSWLGNTLEFHCNMGRKGLGSLLKLLLP